MPVARRWTWTEVTLTWALGLLAEVFAYNRLVAYDQQRALGTVHRLKSPLLRAFYPALGVSDLRQLLLRYIVWLLIPGLLFAATWTWLREERKAARAEPG